MATKPKPPKEEKTMTDAQGRVVPVSYVNAFDRDRDRVARRILARFNKAQNYLARVKAETLKDIAAFRGNDKTGNFQFQSFDGLIRVRLDARTVVEYDHRFQEAQTLIFEYLDELIKANGETDISVLIRAAFQPSAGGLLSRAKVVSLLRLNIKHEKWTRAMTLLRESPIVKSGKTYLYCEVRDTPGGDFENILLDLAAIGPAADEPPPDAEPPAGDVTK